jgi:hypothetical protein
MVSRVVGVKVDDPRLTEHERYELLDIYFNEFDGLPIPLLRKPT